MDLLQYQLASPQMIHLLADKSNLYFKDSDDQDTWLTLYNSLSTQSQLQEFYLHLSFKGFLSSKEYPIKVIRCLKNHKLFNEVLFLDALWSSSSLVPNPNPKDPGSAQPQTNQSFRDFLTIIRESYIVSKTDMIEKLGERSLFESKIVDENEYNKKYRRIFTLNNFTQTKHNLLKECNEGYSKLILILLTLREASDPNKVFKTILSHIGYFNLDPDRVLDLILDSFIQNSRNHRVYLDLLSHFQKTSIPILIANKLGRLAADGQGQKVKPIESVESTLIEIQNNEKTFFNDPLIPNMNLMRVIANLIKTKVIKISDVFENLSPSLQFFNKESERRIATYQSKAKEIFVVNTEEQTEAEKKQKEIQEKNSFFGQYAYSTKLWLMNSLLEINDWEHFKEVEYLLANRFDIITHLPILNTVFRLIEWSIDPIYEKISPKKLFKVKTKSSSHSFIHDGSLSTKQIHQIHQISYQFFDQLEELLKIITNYIGFKTSLYIKICRIFRKIIGSKDLKCSPDYPIEVARQRIKIIISNYFLPALHCQNSNSTLALQLFPILITYDYTTRMEIYTNNLTKLMLSCGYFYRQFAKLKKQQNILMNTLSKDNKKQYYKRIGKLSHNHSFYLFYWIARRMMIGDYEATIPEVVNIIGNCTKLALQSFVFVIFYFISNENNGSKIVQIKTSEVLPWFRHCYLFLSLFYRKYYQADLMPVFGYVISKLQRTIKDVETEFQGISAVELKVLKELISKMSGITAFQNLTKDQFSILAAGPKLQLEIMTPSADIKAAKRSKAQLQNFLTKKTLNFNNKTSLAFNLLVLIGQKRNQFLSKSSIVNIQQFAGIYDEYTSTFMQFLRVLVSQCPDHLQFQKVVPQNCLRQMVVTYKLPLELAFSVARYSTKSITSMMDQQYTQLVTDVYSVLNTYATNPDMVARGRNERPGLGAYLSQYHQKLLKYMPQSLFVAFWYMTLDSVYYPGKAYSEKLEELKKKMIGEREKDLEKAKSLNEKIYKESESQKKKFLETTTQQRNKEKMIVEKLKSKDSKDKEATDNFFFEFVEVFAQTCIIPRMLLEPTDSLYCVKFILFLIKSNELSSNKSVKLITEMVQVVLPYLSCCTYKQTLQCMSVFVSQLLNIFSNWKDQDKLKNDFVIKLGMDESLIKNNYHSMRMFLLQFFQKIGKALKTQRDEPFNIKNGLYLLDKLDVIPAYRQQAEEFEGYLGEMKKKFEDQNHMKTILDRILNMIIRNKDELFERPEDQRRREAAAVTSVQAGSGGSNPVPEKAMIVEENKREDVRRQEPVGNRKTGENSKDLVITPPQKAMEVEKEVRNKDKSLNKQKEKEKQKSKEKEKQIRSFNKQPPRTTDQTQARKDTREYPPRQNRQKDQGKPLKDTKEGYTNKDYRDRETKDVRREGREPRQNQKFTTAGMPEIEKGQIVDAIPPPKTVRDVKDNHTTVKHTHIPIPGIASRISIPSMDNPPPPPPNPPVSALINKPPAPVPQKPIMKQNPKRVETEITSRLSQKQQVDSVKEKQEQQKLMERIRSKNKPQATQNPVPTNNAEPKVKPAETGSIPAKNDETSDKTPRVEGNLKSIPERSEQQESKEAKDTKQRDREREREREREKQRQRERQREKERERQRERQKQRQLGSKRDGKDKPRWQKDERDNSKNKEFYQSSSDKSKRYYDRDREYDSRSNYDRNKRSRSREGNRRR